MKLDGFLGADLTNAAARAGELERLGYDGAFTAEGPHEPFLGLALAAAHTARLELMTNIAVGFARSPVDLAQAANDLQQLSRGRFILGLGSQIRAHITKRFSMPWSHPAARMRELVLAVKAIQQCWWQGTPLRFEGQFYRHTLMTPMFSPGRGAFPPPPVFVAALGPRMTEVAAEVADGLLVHPFHTGAFIKEATAPALERGRPDPKSFTVGATVMVATATDDAGWARADSGIRTLVSFYGSTPAYRVVLDHHGWGDLQTELNRLSKEGRWADMAAVTPQEVIDALVVRGRPSEIGQRIQQRYAGLVDRVSLSIPYELDPPTLAEVVASFSETRKPPR